jgi:hypothetical protein
MKRANASGELPGGIGAQVADLLPDVGVCEHAVHVRAQPLERRLRRRRGREQPEPADRLVARHAGFGDRRQLGQRLRALRARGRDRLQLSSPGVLDHRLRRREEQIDLPGEQVGGGLPHALVGNVQQVHLRHRLEELARKMRRRARAGRPEAELPRV